MNVEETLRGRLVMAPMSRGTDLPFRRLAAEWGASLCVGEMAYAHKVVRRSKAELALLRRHPDERLFCAQLAGKKPEVMAEAARIAESMGADMIDVNLGCPIDEATRRGFGASLLRRASRVAAIVAAMKAAVTVPVTIKLRLGWSSEKPTYLKVARAAEEAGADAICLHARSRAQRYRRPADWDAVRLLTEEVRVPVIGNGDVFNWRQVDSRRRETACTAVMVGRRALAKPWIFREFLERRDIELDAEDRLEVLRRYVALCRETLGDDELGRTRTRRFLAFHQDFFCRYRPGASGSGDARDDGRPPEPGLEAWLCRADLPAVEALCAHLVDGEPARPPAPADPGARRAVKLRALG